MSFDSTEVLNLLEEIAKEKAFTVPCTDGKHNLKYKKLNTLHLKQIISTLDDASLSLTAFNNTAIKIMKECLLNSDVNINQLNIIDKVLFLIHSRIECLSEKINYRENSNVQFDLNEVKQKLYSVLQNNLSAFEEQTAETDGIALKYGIPNLETEEQLNTELYLGKEMKAEGEMQEIKDLIGIMLLNEMTKSIKTLTVKDKNVNFSELNFKDKLNLVERLPLSIINKVFDYVQNYKKIIQEALVNSSGDRLNLDGSLFVLK